MSKREKAVGILSRYQRSLADKLIDIVIDHEEELNGAMQNDFYDVHGVEQQIAELGEKLRAVTVTLGCIPAEEPQQIQDVSGQYSVDHQVNIVVSPSVSFSDFVIYVHNEMLNEAAETLQILFGFGKVQSQNATLHFRRELISDFEQTKQRAIDFTNKMLERPITNESFNTSIYLMNLLFGLQNSDARGVVQTFLTNHP